VRRSRKPSIDQVIDQAAAVVEGAVDRSPDAALAPRSEGKVRWHPYEAAVAVMLVSPTRERGRQMLLQARTLSLHAINVTGRQMLYPGSEGALQLIRTDGRIALIGIRVEESDYIGSMTHHSTLRFTPLPEELTTSEFVDRRGHLKLFDTRLNKNRRIPLRRRSA